MDNQPFSDEEKRFVLAEAIRTSSIPLERLFAFLNENSSVPAWDDIQVPRGRNLKQCKDAFESLRVSPPAPIFQSHIQSQSHKLPVPSSSATSSGIKLKAALGMLDTFSTGPPPKRRQSSSDPIITARDIRPTPSSGSLLSMTSFPTPEPKKRGRPSKKDVERKQQEAIARGDILPPASLIKGYQVLGEDASVSGYATILPPVAPPLQYAPSLGIPIKREIPESAESPRKKRRQKAVPKASKATPKQLGEGSFWVNPAVGSVVEPEEPHTTTSRATLEAVPVTGPVEVASSVPSSFPTEVTIPDADSDLDDSDSDLSFVPDLGGETSEDRISAPKVYFDKLRTLEQEIFDNSGIAIYRHGVSSSKTDDTQFICSSKSLSSQGDAIDARSVLSLVIGSSSGMLLRLLECYDLMVRTRSSLKRLQEAGYCNTHISILVQDGDRMGVAKLVQTEIQSILNVGTILESLLRNSFAAAPAMRPDSASQETLDAIIEGQDDQIGFTSGCLKILCDIGLSPHLLSSDTRSIVWECAFQCLDLAILSYAGAHIQRFDLEHMESGIISFTIPRRFEYHDQTLRNISSSSGTNVITMRRRQFQCLDKFLANAQPWVFHQDICDLGSQRLCLSTTIGALSDIWGPAWMIVRDSVPGRIQQLDIGNGAILPWPTTTQHGESKIEAYPSEVFCHWIRFRDLDAAEIEENQARLARGYFVESDVLLVGATSKLGLFVNENCILSAENLVNIKTKLNQQGALRYPNTFRDRRYLDSHAVQVQGSAGFFTASETTTYKRRMGQTLKEALVEKWRHGNRELADLQTFGGVEISLCTRNTRRRRLLHLLGSPTMHNHLRAIYFDWISEALKQAYSKALRSRKRFVKFWDGLNHDQRKNAGDAISNCLDALEETGIDDESRELRGLWVESFNAEGNSDDESENDQTATPPPNFDSSQAHSDSFEKWIVTLFRSEYTWTGLLKDSVESFTMATLGTTCLQFDHDGCGRRCSHLPSTQASARGSKGYPVLQTFLLVNESLLSNSKLKPETASNGKATVWNAEEVKKGTTFCLGDHGSFKVLTPASRACPMITEWTGVKSEIVKEVKNVAVREKLWGRPNEEHHSEYMTGEWGKKPLPVLVLSKSNKVIFSKE